MTSTGDDSGRWRVVALESVDSTNDEAKRLAVRGWAGGTVVWARRQTAGRARRGRRWRSEPGNLYCSILLRPERSAVRSLEIGFAVAVAVAEAAAALLPAGRLVTCKWPNDVLVGGRKAAGILLEWDPGEPAGGGPWLVVGIGVNVAHHPEGTEFPATSLAAEGARADLPAALVLDQVLARVAHWLDRWRASGFDPVRTAWLDRASGVGARLVVRLEGETLEGTFAGLDRDCALILDAANGRRRITSGDVFPSAA